MAAINLTPGHKSTLCTANPTCTWVGAAVAQAATAGDHEDQYAWECHTPTCFSETIDSLKHGYGSGCYPVKVPRPRRRSPFPGNRPFVEPV